MAAQGCCACAKYVLFILNLIFFLGGLASTGLGIYSLIHTKGDIGVVIDNREGTFGGFLIAVGVLGCCLSAAGCLGAARENRCALLFYAIALSIIFVMEAAAGGVGYHYRNKLRSIVDTGMLKTLNAYDPRQLSGNVERSWSRVQGTFKCCGVDSPADWHSNSSKWSQEKSLAGTYPTSCCHSPSQDLCKNETAMGFRDSGCLHKVLSSLESSWTIWAGLVISVAVVQLFGIICACGLQQHIKRLDYSLV